MGCNTVASAQTASQQLIQATKKAAANVNSNGGVAGGPVVPLLDFSKLK